ncbi:cytochrome P450, partial [Aureobasidium melanogenum]
MFKSLHHSAEVHIKRPIEKHIDQANDNITRIIDFAPIIERFALQAFSNMASGQDLDEQDVTCISLAVSQGQWWFMMMTMFPWTQDLVGGFLATLRLERHIAFGRTLATVVRIVEGRFGENKRTSTPRSIPQKRLYTDIISGLMDADLSVEEAANNLNVQIIASAAVTAPAIAHMCARYMKQPLDEQNAVRSELDRYFRKWTSGTPPALNRNEHPYSLALINECLRVCPPAAFFREKVCLGAAMKDPKTFGDQADEFDLSRWLKSDIEDLQRMEDCLGLCFGSGMSECLGKRTAFGELVVFLYKTAKYRYQIVNRAEFARFSNNGVLRVTDMHVFIWRLGESIAPNFPAQNLIGPLHGI